FGLPDQPTGSFVNLHCRTLFDIVESDSMIENRENGEVGLVLVSHSAAIAEGLAELVGQVAGSDVEIVAAGGGPDGSLGTDGGKVLDALRHAAAGGGAVVLVDIGSPVMTGSAARVYVPAAERKRLLVAGSTHDV